jgi:N-acetylmuramoyl-L-alanine amidase
VSAHYVVDRTGEIYQLVQDSETAWHSGNKTVNQQSIGIETVAWKAASGMTAKQEAALILLAKFVLEAYGISLSNVVPHRATKPTDCPGFIWPTDPDFDTWKNTNLS